MRKQLLPKRFEFTEADRDDILLSDPTKIQIDSVNNCVSLVPSLDDEYPLDAELYVVTKRTSPDSWLKWKMILVGVYHVREGTTYKTSHRVRLHNGVTHYWWNGAAWAVAGVGNWNTEAQINANIATFPFKTFGVVVNLATTDKRFTPSLQWIVAAYEGRIYFWEDILYRSLVPAIRNGVRPIAEYPIKLTASSSTISLADNPMDTSFELDSIDSVFDHEADPNHYTDLFGSYNPATKVITLTSPVAANHTAWVRFVYSVPVILVTQNIDYQELAKLPSILIENVRELGSQTVVWKEHVFDRGTNTGFQFAAPYSTTIGFDIIAVAPGGVDSYRLQEELVSYFDANPFLTSKGLDDRYRLHLISEFTDTSEPEVAGTRTLRATAEIRDVLSFHKPATGLSPTRRIRLVGDVEADINVP